MHQRTNLDTENETTLHLQSQPGAYEIGRQAGVFVVSCLSIQKTLKKYNAHFYHEYHE